MLSFYDINVLLQYVIICEIVYYMFMISYCIMQCNINIILTHIYTHMCMHVCTRTFVDVRSRVAQVNPYEYLP